MNLNLDPSHRPRVAFVIPIVSARAVGQWRAACELLQRTLASIFNSSNGSFCVAVAGHEPPDFALPRDARFQFLSLSHPLPDSGRRDKMMKLAAAWDHAKSTWRPQYVMKVDGDDLISARLVEWLVSAEDKAGYRVNDGWVWHQKWPFLIECHERLDRTCGSCLIIRGDLADREVPVAGGAGTLLLNDEHQDAEAQFAHLGERIEKVPFAAVIYRIHGHNMCGIRVQSLRMLLGRMRRLRPFTRSLKQEFALA